MEWGNYNKTTKTTKILLSEMLYRKRFKKKYNFLRQKKTLSLEFDEEEGKVINNNEKRITFEWVRSDRTSKNYIV